MNRERIDILLDKYWNCESTLEEEKELHNFFLDNKLPADLECFKPLFDFTKEVKHNIPSDNFNREIMLLTDMEKQKVKTFPHWSRSLLKIAASFFFIFTLGTVIFFATKQQRQIFTETYNDPEAALKEATIALEKLSASFRMSEEASIRTLEQLEKLDLNWNEIDSLSAAFPIFDEADEEAISETNNDL